MTSVGEVMSIGRNFEEAIQKAVRMVNPGLDGLEGHWNEVSPPPLCCARTSISFVPFCDMLFCVGGKG
jgi:carbamoylphosphate synthase large subunit